MAYTPVRTLAIPCLATVKITHSIRACSWCKEKYNLLFAFLPLRTVDDGQSSVAGIVVVVVVDAGDERMRKKSGFPARDIWQPQLRTIDKEAELRMIHPHPPSQ